MVRKQSYKTYRTQKGRGEGNQAAFNRADGKADVNGASPQEPRLCRRRRASALCGNPSARGAPLALAGHRPCRKLRYNTFPLQQDWRGAPCGNLPTLENNIVAFASGGLRARSLPPELAAPLEANPRRLGVSGVWVQDVLRHTYASYHAKLFRDLPRLQVNIGHRDISLLSSRYVNMSEIAKADAEKFFLNSN